MREIDKVRSLSAEELVKYFGVDCSRCGKCKSAEEVNKKSYDDCVKGNIEFFEKENTLEDLGYKRLPSEFDDTLIYEDDDGLTIVIYTEIGACEKYYVSGGENLSLLLSLEELKIILQMLEK